MQGLQPWHTRAVGQSGGMAGRRAEKGGGEGGGCGTLADDRATVRWAGCGGGRSASSIWQCTRRGHRWRRPASTTWSPPISTTAPSSIESAPSRGRCLSHPASPLPLRCRFFLPALSNSASSAGGQCIGRGGIPVGRAGRCALPLQARVGHEQAKLGQPLMPCYMAAAS